jgi:archaetidylinositol phosphate synthase
LAERSTSNGSEPDYQISRAANCRSIGRSLGKAQLTPDIFTGLGFALALLAGFLFALKASQPYLAGVSILGSGIMDILDGSLARATGKAAGSVNDSVFDRMSDIAMYAGIVYAGYGLNHAIVLLTIGLSLLVSYLRIKAESLGVEFFNLGLGERADRLAVLMVFAFVGYVWIGVYVSLALALIALVWRYAYVARAFGALRA